MSRYSRPGYSEFVWENRTSDTGDRSSGEQSATGRHGGEVIVGHDFTVEVGDGFRFGGTVDGDDPGLRGELGQGFQKAGKDGGTAGVEVAQARECALESPAVLGKAFEENGRGGDPRDAVALNLVEETGGVHVTGPAQVRVGQHGGHTGSEICQHEDRQSREVDIARLQVQAGCERVVLSEEECVGPDGSLGHAGAAAGEGDQRGIGGLDGGRLGRRSRFGHPVSPASGKGKPATDGYLQWYPAHGRRAKAEEVRLGDGQQGIGCPARAAGLKVLPASRRVEEDRHGTEAKEAKQRDIQVG